MSRDDDNPREASRRPLPTSSVWDGSLRIHGSTGISTVTPGILLPERKGSVPRRRILKHDLDWYTHSFHVSIRVRRPRDR